MRQQSESLIISPSNVLYLEIQLIKCEDRYNFYEYFMLPVFRFIFLRATAPLRFELPALSVSKFLTDKQSVGATLQKLLLFSSLPSWLSVPSGRTP